MVYSLQEIRCTPMLDQSKIARRRLVEAIQGVCHQLANMIRDFCIKRNDANKHKPFPAHRKWQPTGGYFALNRDRVKLDRQGERIQIPKIGWVACRSLEAVPTDRAIKSYIIRQSTGWIIVIKT